MPLYKNHIGGDGDPSQRMREGFEFSLGGGERTRTYVAKCAIFYVCICVLSGWELDHMRMANLVFPSSCCLPSCPWTPELFVL